MASTILQIDTSSNLDGSGMANRASRVTNPAAVPDAALPPASMQSHESRTGGFTLLELMIVVGVIAIIAAVAIPNYRQFILRSQRSEAIIALTELANLQEKFYSANSRYIITPASIAPSLSYPTTTSSSYYLLSAAAPTGGGNQGYTLRATAQSGQAQFSDTRCRTFTLDNVGRKGATDSSGGGGVGTAQARTCWER
jgi:type IV pilus assembly protein PilE